MDKKIKYNNTIVDYSDEIIEKIQTDYEIGYICKDCGSFTPEDNITFVTSNTGYEYPVCEDCISNSESYFFCDDCNYWFDDTVNRYITHDDRTICNDCRYDHYTECRDCEELFDNNDNQVYYCEECDEWYCESCYDDNHQHQQNLLYDYHDFNDWKLHSTSEENPAFYIGHELEIDDGSLTEEVVNTITSTIPAICMHDGSLSDDGIEIISHPLSYNYMLSQENNYRELFDTLSSEYHYKSHNTSTCGLHFHVTRPQNPDIIDRILLFMETYKEEIIRLSRRTTGEIESWCNFLSDRRTNVSEKQLKSLDYIKKNKETSHRYMALNLTNYNTIEFRIFKGTLNYDTFMADFEFVYNLTTLASDLSLPVSELTWTKVTSMGKFLPQYITTHSLETDKSIIDYSLEIITERNKKIETLKEDLYNLYKEVMTTIHKLTTINKKELIDISELSIHTSQLEAIVRDLKYLQKTTEYDDDMIKTVESTIKYINERRNKTCA